MKICPKCGGTDFYKDSKGENGRLRCKICHREKMRKIYATPEYKAKRREYTRQRLRNCNKDLYDKLQQDQKGKCAICGEYRGEKLRVDHCHHSGKVRGLLCDRCNVGIGYFKDRLDVLLNAVNYLKQNI